MSTMSIEKPWNKNEKIATSTKSIEKPWNKKLYLVTSLIILVIITIAASVLFINKNNSLSGAKENENPSSYSSGSVSGGGGGGDDNIEDDTPYPFRIFFTRSGKIYSTKANGTDIQDHYKRARSGLSLNNLIVSNSRSKLLFYDQESIKVLKLATDEIYDLGIKSRYFSLSSDDKKLVYISINNPNELVLFDIKSKREDLRKDFGFRILSFFCYVPQLISNNSEIVFEATGSDKTSNMVKFNIETKTIEKFFDGDNSGLQGQFKLSPDGKLAAFLTEGMIKVLKIYDFESRLVKDCVIEHMDASILQWSDDSKSIYLSYADKYSNTENNNHHILIEYNVIKEKLIFLEDENGKNIEVFF